MASKDRILRLKETTRTNILKASLQIVKAEGWPALSLRKIANLIDYSAPVIYEYFQNKKAILMEHVRHGFLILLKNIRQAEEKKTNAAKRLEDMWMAYWNFAANNKEYYQLMFGIQTVCLTDHISKLSEWEMSKKLFSDVIKELLKSSPNSPHLIAAKYHACWSVVHGLISINIVSGGFIEQMNNQILKNTIQDIIQNIGNYSINSNTFEQPNI